MPGSCLAPPLADGRAEPTTTRWRTTRNRQVTATPIPFTAATPVAPLVPLAQIPRVHDYQEAVRRTDRELGANRVQRVVGMLRPTLPCMDHRRLGHRTQLAHIGARRPNEA